MKSRKIFTHFSIMALVLVSSGVGGGQALADSISVEKAIYNKLKERIWM